MTKHFKILIFSSLVLLLAFTSGRKQAPLEFEKGNYQTGENLNYRLHYAFVTAGKAMINVDDKLYQVQEKPCYKMYVMGWTTPFFALGFRIKDTWSSFVDTSSSAPQQSMRDIHEGKYNLHEDVIYDYGNSKAKVIRKHPDRDKEELEYKIPNNVQDIVSGFFQLRRINYNKMKIGDTISMKAFFDKENYNFKVRYMGKGTVNVDAGEFAAIKLVPVMPKNGMFNGEESIKVWISDDKNKIPLMAEAEMFLGSVKLELTSYKGLKNEVSVIK
ncbi:MAG: DUF3108 domain-containing protein [Cytophagales bacterium]